MSLAITLTLPAFITPPVIAATTLVVGVAIVAYGAYKYTQYRKAKNVVSNQESLATKVKRKVKLIFKWTAAKIQHHWLMLAGSMPAWAFFIVGKAGSVSVGSGIRAAVKRQPLPVLIIGTVIGTIIEQAGSLATDLTTVFHPHAVAYRIEYKERVKSIRTVNA